MNKNFLRENRNPLMILVLLCLIYYINNFILGKLIGGFLGSYILPSLMWLGLVFSIERLPKFRTATKLRFRPLFCGLGFISAIGAVLITYAIGFLVGLGKSPYDHSFIGIIKNTFYLGATLVGMEFSRSWILRASFRKKPTLGIGIISFIYTFFWFTPARLTGLNENIKILEFIGETYFPALSENVFASYLALLGGPLPAMVYRGTLLACEWFIPILPNFNWVMRALTGTLLPLFGLIFTHQLYSSEALRNKRERVDNKDLIGWILTAVVSVLILWFSLGLFNIFPNVILTGSMEPRIAPGDIVIVKKISPDIIKEGDIIQFIEEDARINHRIIGLSKDEGGREFFITKGDANENPDLDPVYPEQVTGKIVYVVPKLGWITIMVRRTS